MYFYRGKAMSSVFDDSVVAEAKKQLKKTRIALVFVGLFAVCQLAINLYMIGVI